MRRLTAAAIRFWKRTGFLRTMRESVWYVLERVQDWYFDRKFGIRTSRRVTKSDLGYDNPLVNKYAPTDYRGFMKVMKRVRIRPGEDVFVDLGSGMGRVLIMAGLFPFRKIIGVEMSPELIRQAAENIDRARKKLTCPDIELVESSLTEYTLPPEASILYFYVPVRGEMLSRVLQGIHDAALAAPRKVTFVCHEPAPFEEIAHEHPWLTKRAEFTNLSRIPYALYEYEPDSLPS